MIPRIFAILGSLDTKTAGRKTYVGLAIAAAALVAGHFGAIPPESVDLAVSFGLIVAGVGKVLADTRSSGAPAPGA